MPPLDRNDWRPDHTYVIGHQRPDTDSIAAALGYAWFLTETGRENIVPARAGQPGEQARYALERFEQAPPPLLAGVAPTFGHVLETVAALRPDAPLADALARLGDGAAVVPIADESGRAKGVVTPLALARAFARAFTHGDNDASWCGDLVEPAPTVRARDRISDHRTALLRAEFAEFVVTSDSGLYLGLASQKSLLHPPRARLILVDHNELTQAVAGADEAEIVGVLDHHRLGNPPTASPIPFTVDPVGSTSTLIAELCRSHRLKPPRPIAGLLLSGILSDTLVFRSPTATPRDESAAQWLGGLIPIDIPLYGKELLESAPGLAVRTIEEILDGDRKTYIMAGVPVSIGQVEVNGMQELPQRREEILDGLSVRRVRESLSLIALMVTDVVTGTSVLFSRGERRLNDLLPFSRIGDAEFDLGEIVSRKKQLAPAIQAALESA